LYTEFFLSLTIINLNHELWFTFQCIPFKISLLPFKIIAFFGSTYIWTNQVIVVSVHMIECNEFHAKSIVNCFHSHENHFNSHRIHLIPHNVSSSFGLKLIIRQVNGSCDLQLNQDGLPYVFNWISCFFSYIMNLISFLLRLHWISFNITSSFVSKLDV